MAAFRGYKVGLYYGNDQSGGVSLTGFSLTLLFLWYCFGYNGGCVKHSTFKEGTR